MKCLESLLLLRLCAALRLIAGGGKTRRLFGGPKEA